LAEKHARLAERVRKLRVLRGLNLRDAEAATGVSRSMLSKIERGAASPTATVLGKLAEGFGMSISQLLGGPGPAAKRRVIVLRKDHQALFRDPSTGFERRSLAPVRKGRAVDLVVNTLPPGGTSGTFPPHKPGVEETLAVALGQLWLFLDGRRIALEAGDSVFYRANVGHRFKNPSRTEAAVFYIVIDGTKAA
jgi:transcriptional regulator with XRE-family HTH domain